MVKLIVLAFSICAATMAGSYAKKQFTATPEVETGEKGDSNEGSNSPLTETDLLALPVIVDGELAGFFFLRLAYTSNPVSTSVPAELLLSDGFYQFAASAPEASQSGMGKLEIDEVAQGVKSAVNRLTYKPVISDIFVTQIDYFASADVRKKSIERRLVLKEETAKKAPAANGHAAPADGGHAAPAH
jgi:hypothetical protein